MKNLSLRSFQLLILVMICFFWVTCSSPKEQNSLSQDIEMLMKIHNDQRVSHFEKKPEILLNQGTDKTISVNKGVIDSTATPESSMARWNNYFNSVEFKKWDDVNPPVIRFSTDRSLAYMIVDKEVILETLDEVGKKVEETTHFAWVTILRKQSDGQWKMECIISTNQPNQIKPL